LNEEEDAMRGGTIVGTLELPACKFRCSVKRIEFQKYIIVNGII